MAGMRARNVLMVYPRFVADSFFNFRAACEAIGRRSAAAPLGLITVAAMLPPEWSVRLLDRNVEELTDGDLAWADLVMTGRHDRSTARYARHHQICAAHAAIAGRRSAGRTRPPVRMSIARADFQVSARPKTSSASSSRRWDGGARARRVRGSQEFRDRRPQDARSRASICSSSNTTSMSACSSRAAVLSPANSATSSSSTAGCRAPRPMHRCWPSWTSSIASAMRGMVDFVDDNLIGNKKALKTVSAGAGAVAPGARLSLRVRDRGLDQSRRR